MKMRDKKDEMILTLALLEQLENDEEMKEFERHENEEKTWSVGKETEGKCPSHVFSESHNQRMKQIFKMAARAEKKQKRRRRLLKMGVGFAACLCVSTAMVFSSSAFWVPILNFFTEMREKYSELALEREMKIHVTENFKEYEPKYVVRGFNTLEVKEKDTFFRISYVDDRDGWYYYDYYENPHSIQIDTEDVIKSELMIGDSKAVIYKKDKYIYAVYYKDSKQFIVIGNISEAEVKKVLESIQI